MGIEQKRASRKQGRLASGDGFAAFKEFCGQPELADGASLSKSSRSRPKRAYLPTVHPQGSCLPQRFFGRSCCLHVAEYSASSSAAAWLLLRAASPGKRVQVQRYICRPFQNPSLKKMHKTSCMRMASAECQSLHATSTYRDPCSSKNAPYSQPERASDELTSRGSVFRPKTNKALISAQAWRFCARTHQQSVRQAASHTHRTIDERRFPL